MKQPLVVAYGVGRDSTALLVEMHRRGIRPDAITFANIGSEKQATYAYIPTMNAWLADHGFPPITVVRYRPDSAPYRTLEGNCILNATLPSAAFNCGACTDKFKIAPQNRWSDTWALGQEALARGMPILKFVGFECDETHRLSRADARAHAGKGSKKYARRFQVEYPLMTWGHDLAKCIDIIQSAGLPVPVKSACFFCPNQKRHEVHALSPDERARIILMEVAAEPYNQKMRGLWRRTSITEYILAEKLPFTPLPVLGKRVVLNPACKKARTGATFHPPHSGPTLRSLLEAAGHEVPEVVTEGPLDDAYAEDNRGPAADLIPSTEPAIGSSALWEDEAHAELVGAL